MIKTNGLKQSDAQIEKLKKLAEGQRKTDEKFMSAAIKEAKKALALGEIPVGAVITRNGEIVATGYNRKETDGCAVYHAEINAIVSASEKLGWRLDDCEMYVTLEPCAMCGGAIVSARIKRLVFGAKEPKSGFFGSVADISSASGLNHSVEVESGILEDECKAVLAEFFAKKRKNPSGV